MSHLRFTGKIILLFFFMAFTQIGAYGMGEDLKITIEPPIFDVRHLDPKAGEPRPTSGGTQEFLLGMATPDIFPEPTRLGTVERTLTGYKSVRYPGVSVNLPSKIRIEISNSKLKDFYWRQVRVPVVINVTFARTMPEKGIFMSFVDKSGHQNLQIVQIVQVEPKAWRDNQPVNTSSLNRPDSRYQEPIKTERAYGMADYWNMTYFTNLPKCSMSYDFWVTVRGIESEHKPFDIEFYVDGQKITQDNFEKMAEKYPALKDKLSQ